MNIPQWIFQKVQERSSAIHEILNSMCSPMMEFPVMQINEVPSHPGVYAILSSEQEEILYVGQAQDLQKRIRHHSQLSFESPSRTHSTGQEALRQILLEYRQSKLPLKVGFIKVLPKQERLFIEHGLIYFFNPTCNNPNFTIIKRMEKRNV